MEVRGFSGVSEMALEIMPLYVSILLYRTICYLSILIKFKMGNVVGQANSGHFLTVTGIGF